MHVTDPSAQESSSLPENSIRLRLRAYIVDNFLLGDGEYLHDDTGLMEAGILDSTAAMELVAFLEDGFGITVEEHEIIPENFNTIDDLRRFVVHKSADC
jgi:acyl carrier protein